MTGPEPNEEGELDDVWPPPEAQAQAAAWEAEHLLERGHFVHAALAVERVLPLVPPGERAFYLGLRHLAAAGWRVEGGRRDAAARQLAHARRRLRPFLPAHREVDLAALLDAAERRLQA